jgi:MoaA/NifB/PqqE/SkfB family radical SAM enzyme
MEFTKPILLTIENILESTEELLLLPYTQLKLLRPVKIDDNLHLLEDDESQALFREYVNRKLMLIPVARSNPKPKARDDIPSRVVIELTSRCNLHCTMCPSRNLQRPRMDMDTALVEKCIDELDEIGLDGIWLYDIGDPLLHPNFLELLDYVSSKNNLGTIWISSNGQELTEHISRKIISSKIGFINMSVNSTSAETLAKVSPGADWNRMKTNFAKFIKLKRDSGQRTPFTRIQIIEDFACGDMDTFIKEYAVSTDMLSVNALEIFSQNVNTVTEYANIRQRAKKYCKRINRRSLTIFSNGETSFCLTDFNGFFSMGNVKEKSIYDIWNGDIRKRIIKLNKEGRLNEVEMCKDCLDYDL